MSKLIGRLLGKANGGKREERAENSEMRAFHSSLFVHRLSFCTRRNALHHFFIAGSKQPHRISAANGKLGGCFMSKWNACSFSFLENPQEKFLVVGTFGETLDSAVEVSSLLPIQSYLFCFGANLDSGIAVMVETRERPSQLSIGLIVIEHVILSPCLTHLIQID